MADTPHTSSASRRAFLAAGLALPAAAAMAPVAASGQAARRAAAPASARHALKIGAVTYNIAKDWDVATIIKNFTDVGLDGVELRTTHAHGVEPTLTAAQRAEVRARFEASPVKIARISRTSRSSGSPEARIAWRASS